MATSKSADKKPHHITNIRYPYAKTWDKRNTSIEFELANAHFSTANAIRRLILSSVKTVGFRTEPYEKCDVNIKINDTPLHNQFTAHRIAMIPINVPNPDKFNVDDYVFFMDITNNTNENRQITTEDFQIRQISTNKLLSHDEVKRFFPPDPITGNYILLTKLRAKYFVPSKTLNQEAVAEMVKDFNQPVDEPVKLFFEAKASISNGAENGHYCPVSCACYINTVDPERARDGLRVYIDNHNNSMKLQKLTPLTPEILTRRFELTERAKFYYVNDRDEPNVFTFKIESIGVIPPLIIFHRAIDILIEKINTFISNIISKNENIITINQSNQLNNGYEIVVKNEDDTLGNIIQSHLCMMYADYSLSKEQRKLKFIGYKKPHPLEHHIIFVIQGNTDKIDEIHSVCFLDK
jgi:DNA-directed RNA polymerase subunit L